MSNDNKGFVTGGTYIPSDGVPNKELLSVNPSLEVAAPSFSKAFTVAAEPPGPEPVQPSPSSTPPTL